MKLIVALASAVALLAAPASGDPTLAPLTIGALPTDGGSVVFYAKDLGYFERHGIDATVNTMSSGSAMSAAVVGGTLDIGNSNAATIAQARERGVPLRFIAPSSVAIPPPAMTDVIMVAGNSAIRAGSDANGKVFGVSALKNLTQIQAQSWVDHTGGDAKTVRFVEIPPPQMGAALQTGRIDLAVMVEPFVSAEKQQGGRVIGDALAGIAPRFMITGWFARDGWIEDHQDLAARFAAAIKEAAEWANAHPQESAAILARHSSIPADVASTMGRARFGTVLDPQMIKPVLDAAVRYGALDTPLDANEIVWKASK